MWLYFFLYIPISLISILIGKFFLMRYKNIAWYFFLFFCIFSWAWFILYFLFFSWIYQDIDILLYLSRATFTMWILSVYSLMFFVKYFEPVQKNISFKKLIITLLIYAIFSIYTIFTENIISWLIFSESDWVYREVYGRYFFLLPVLYALYFILYSYYSFWNSKKFSMLSRLRLRNISHATFLAISVLIFLQLILPLFNIWILEKEVILIYLFFVIYATYTIRRYYFSPILQEYRLVKIWITILSWIISIFGLNFIKYFYLKIPFYMDSFWIIWDQYNAIDSIIVVILFFIVYEGLWKFFLVENSENILKQNIDILKQALLESTTIDNLNKILQWWIRKIFKTNFSKVILFEDNEEYSELKKYFSQSLWEKVFINDIVFIEENKSKFNKNLIVKNLDKDIMLVFPIFNTDSKIIWLYFLWKKPFWDFYTMNEIKIFFSLVKFLWLHLKYLVTYKKIQDYSLQLDQRIDDKTIEYNDLINKQKEFISMISHEIRSPIWSTIFQVDSLVDSINKDKISTIEIKYTIKDIWDQLVNIGELLKKLFSIQYFDTRDVVLLKEKIQMWNLLEKEFDIYSRMYEDISFVKNISNDIGFINIDKIHFHQVLTNLIENAIKFADPTDPVVLIECSILQWNNKLHINIEDNGNSYWDIDTSTIFEKYSKWNHAKLWLWMWLYLCKRIITMHDWTITANNGKTLGGASFVIMLPI